MCRGRAPGPLRFPAECVVSLMPFAMPALAWQRLAPGFLPRLRERIMYAALNYGAILRLRRCDVFICMSGIYLEAARFARRRYGARIWVERGSRHILSQDRILRGRSAPSGPADSPCGASWPRTKWRTGSSSRRGMPRKVSRRHPICVGNCFATRTVSILACFRRDARKTPESAAKPSRSGFSMSGHGRCKKAVICSKLR